MAAVDRNAVPPPEQSPAPDAAADAAKPAAIAVVGVFVLVTGLAAWRLRVLSALGSQSFAATRAEIAADLALLKSRM